jgi:hypothetical protein
MNNKQILNENNLKNYHDASNNNFNDSTRFNLLTKKNNSEIKGNYLVLHQFKIIYALIYSNHSNKCFKDSKQH